jgi:acetyl esterase/lipase
MTWPVGYMITVAIAAWCTFFAVAAPRRPNLLARSSWLFGMIINEVPFLAGLFLIASTVLAAVEGDLDKLPGRIAAGVAGVVLAGLCVVAWRGVRSARTVDQALSTGLGSDWKTVSTRTWNTHQPWLRILLFPFVYSQPGVERIKDIRYGDAGRYNLLDIYRRRDAFSDAPVLVYFHGGGFTTGRKSHEAKPLLMRLARSGRVCISANYRLRPEFGFPDHQIDAKKVIAWVREHSEEYGMDPTKLFVSGSSAGANLAGLCAFTPNDPRFQPGMEDRDTAVTGAILLYGYYGHYFGDEPDGPPSELQPQGYFSGRTPPLFIAHGSHDGWGTVEAARNFAVLARNEGANTVVYAELHGGQHSFDIFHSARFDAVVDGVAAFTDWVLAESRVP